MYMKKKPVLSAEVDKSEGFQILLGEVKDFYRFKYLGL